MESDRLSEPTVWSFLPVGILAVLALVLALAWPVATEAEAFDGQSIWSYALVAFHVIAVLGCARGSLSYLRSHADTRTPGSIRLAWFCLVLSVGYALAFVALYFFTERWTAPLH